jgi:hypothetical protein
LRDPRVAKQLNETQQVTFALGGPEELAEFVSEQMRLWGPVAREHNIQADWNLNMRKLTQRSNLFGAAVMSAARPLFVQEQTFAGTHRTAVSCQ